MIYVYKISSEIW